MQHHPIPPKYLAHNCHCHCHCHILAKLHSSTTSMPRPVGSVSTTPPLPFIHPQHLWTRLDRPHASIPLTTRISHSPLHADHALNLYILTPSFPFFWDLSHRISKITLTEIYELLRAYRGAWMSWTGIVQSLKPPPLRGGAREPAQLS